MTHTYPLHRAVDVLCHCCGLVCRFTFGSYSDQVVCKGCIRHYGMTSYKLGMMNADHMALWRSEMAVLREDHASGIERLQRVIDERDHALECIRLELADARHAIETQLQDGPMATVEKWFRDTQVTEAHNQRDAAYRSRDHAIRFLWHLDQMHHENNGLCTCKRKTSHCPEWKLLEDCRDWLYKWERKQIERLKDGLDHGLPSDHPEVLEYRRSASSW